jgi:fatty-acyl-CoA synthase
MTERHWSATVADALRDAARHRGERPSFTFADPRTDDRTYTWSSLLEAVRARAAALHALGLRKGDRVALVLPGAEDFVLNFLGAVLGGVVPVPMYPPVALGKVESYVKNVDHIVASSGARVLLVSRQVRPILGSALGTGAVEALRLVEDLDLNAPREGSEPEIHPEDLCFLQYTSGSTSAPKGVRVTHRNLERNAWGIMREALRADPDVDIGLSWLPLYHDMGLIGFVIAPAFDTVHVVFLPTMEFVKRPSLWPERLHHHRATLTFAPNFAYALTARKVTDKDLATWDLSRVRVFGCGAEPIQPSTLRGFTERMASCGVNPQALTPCYGMAEATLAISFASAARGVLPVDPVDLDALREGEARRPDPAGGRLVEVVSCGRVLPGHAVAILGEDGRRLEDRQLGEIAFQGPSVADGYFNNPEATAGAFKDGWLHTGDLGYTADGEVYVCGRAKDMIIVHGRNYYPQDLEWTAQEVPGVRKGSVVAFACQPEGAPSEQLVLVAEYSARERPTDQALEALGKQVTQAVQAEHGLNAWKVVLIPAGTVPKTSSGKLQRRKTREQFEQGTLGQEGPGTDSLQAKAAVAKQVARSYVTLGLNEVVSRLPASMKTFLGRKK